METRTIFYENEDGDIEYKLKGVNEPKIELAVKDNKTIILSNKNGDFILKTVDKDGREQILIKITDDSCYFNKKVYIFDREICTEHDDIDNLHIITTTESNHFNRPNEAAFNSHGDITMNNIFLEINDEGKITNENNYNITVKRTNNGKYEIDYSILRLRIQPIILVTVYELRGNIIVANISKCTTELSSIITKNTNNSYVNCNFNVLIFIK